MSIGNSDRPLSIDELATEYPQVIRRLSSLNRITVQGVECDPQPGEHTRFGVFFYALSQLTRPEDLRQSRPTVAVPTQELPDCCQNRELIEQGVLIFPSAVYQLALTDLQRSDPSLGSLELDFTLNHQWIVLDEAAARKLVPPILSIPTKVIIDVAKLIK